MENLKFRTIQDCNITFIARYWRYVNHADKLVTTGFKIKRSLIINKDNIRFNDESVIYMRDRYDSYYNNSKTNLLKK